MGLCNGLSPGWCQAIIWTNAGILLIGPLGTKLNELLIEIHISSFKKINLNMPSAKWRPVCPGFNMLIQVWQWKISRWFLMTSWHGHTFRIMRGNPLWVNSCDRAWGFLLSAWTIAWANSRVFSEFRRPWLMWHHSLWLSDAIWRHKSESILAQVMACCLTAPNHYLNQCWLIVSMVQWHSSEDNFTKDPSATNHWN